MRDPGGALPAFPTDPGPILSVLTNYINSNQSTVRGLEGNDSNSAETDPTSQAREVALKGVSFTAHPGQLVALVGAAPVLMGREIAVTEHDHEEAARLIPPSSNERIVVLHRVGDEKCGLGLRGIGGRPCVLRQRHDCRPTLGNQRELLIAFVLALTAFVLMRFRS